MVTAVTLNRRLAHDVWINIQFIMFPPALVICKHGSVPRKLVQTATVPPQGPPATVNALNAA